MEGARHDSQEQLAENEQLPHNGTSHDSLPLSPAEIATVVTSSSNTSNKTKCDNLAELNDRHLIVYGASFGCVSLIWLILALLMYPMTRNVLTQKLYEARWHLVPMTCTGVMCISVYKYKLESLFQALGIACFYTVSGCMMSLVGYSININRVFLHQNDYTIEHATAALRQRTSVQYIQLCACICACCVCGMILVGLLYHRILAISKSHFNMLSIPLMERRMLFCVAILALCLSGFGLMVMFHLITLEIEQMHSYAFQELYSHLNVILLSLAQFAVNRRPTRLLYKTLLVLYFIQVIAEMFLTWSAYYQALYMSSQQLKYIHGTGLGPMMMPLNFIAHLGRLSICAYAQIRLVLILRFQHTDITVTLSRGAEIFLRISSAACLLLSVFHVIIDVLYTIMGHFYRTVLPFTGVSIFYSTVSGITLSLFIRRRWSFLLAMALTFQILLGVSSVHVLYVYDDVMRSESMTKQLRSQTTLLSSSTVWMYLLEGLVGLFGLIIFIVIGFMLIRILRLNSNHSNAKERKTFMPVLFKLGIVILVTCVGEVLTSFITKSHGYPFHSIFSYNIMDILAWTLIAVWQLYVTHKSNKHVQDQLLVLLLLHLAQCTFMQYTVHSQTQTQQTLLLFNHLYNQAIQKQHLLSHPQHQITKNQIFADSRIAPMLVAHAIQLTQWVVGIASTIFTALALEKVDMSPQLSTGRECISITATSSSVHSGGFGLSDDFVVAYNNPTLKTNDEKRRKRRRKREERSNGVPVTLSPTLSDATDITTIASLSDENELHLLT